MSRSGSAGGITVTHLAFREAYSKLIDEARIVRAARHSMDGRLCVGGGVRSAPCTLILASPSPVPLKLPGI